MISEEQLTKWEHQIDIGTLNCYQAVPKLIAEVRRTVALWRFTSAELREKTEQLDKEAEYLAGCIEWCPDDAPSPGVCFGNGDVDKSECIKCWRKRARKAVKDAVSNTD